MKPLGITKKGFWDFIDAAQLATDMAEVKDKMTKKNIKSSI